MKAHFLVVAYFEGFRDEHVLLEVLPADKDDPAPAELLLQHLTDSGTASLF